MSFSLTTVAPCAVAPLIALGLAFGQEPEVRADADASPRVQASSDGEASIVGAVPQTRADILPRIDELIARHDCLACHDADSAVRERLDPVAAPELQGVIGRVDRGWLVEFLEDPRGVRAETTHPHQLAGLPETGRALVAESIVQFLASVSAEGGAPAEETSYVGELERGRQLFHAIGCVACHGPQEDAYDLEVTLVELEAEQAAAAAAAEDDAEAEADEYLDEPVPVLPGVFAPDDVALPTDLARKYRLSGLAAYLGDPVAVRPSGHCPSMGLSESESRAIAAYLLRAQAQRMDGTYERRPGLFLRAYEGQFGARGITALESLTPVKTKIVRAIGVDERTRDDQFGLRFNGFVEVPTDGTYTFYLRSDDGSRLWIGGELLVDNGGVHGPATKQGTVELLAGAIPIDVSFFEAGGGQQVSLEWEGPGIERSELPPGSFSHWPLIYRVLGADGLPATEPAAAEGGADVVERGRLGFARLGCATCHAGILEGPPPATVRRPPPLDQLAGVRPGVLVCLRPDGRYGFDQETVGQLLSSFLQPEMIAANAEDPAVHVQRRLAGRRCYSCHRRDGLGGVHPDVAQFYTGDEDAELGDQGRFPPTLTAVGRKFRPDVLRAALRGEESVRPYLTTRMPKMGERGVAGLAELLESVDDAAGLAAEEPISDVTTINAGRRLAGDRGGLGCVQCHGFLGTKSLGVQAVDLGEMHRRLSFGWFRDLLRDPSNVDLAARMANLWIDGESPVKDVADGEIDGQIAALWCWLGEGAVMAPPPGLDSGPWAYEIDASDRTRAISVFMKDVSPRVLCVGTPESVHFAFDEQGVRLAKIWRGRFLNVEGTWKGRAGALESPASKDVADTVPGLSVVLLADLSEPWPQATGREASARTLGRSTNLDGSMTFRYAIGDLRVEETVAPARLTVSMGPADTPKQRLGIERRFVVRMAAGTVGRSVVARVVAARQFDRLSSGRWRLDGGEWPLIEVDGQSAPIARVVQPKPSESNAFGAGEDDRPLLAARERTASGDKTGSPSRVLDELRIPVLMTPEGDGSGTLIGSFSWRYAW